jgi:hypothetical protein
MTSFDDEYWNLCQAAVWIEFRERPLVERFREADGEAYSALHFYPGMWPPDRKQHGTINELLSSLKSNSLKALGFHYDTIGQLDEIPAPHWYDMDLRPPRVLDARERQREIWTRVKVRRRDILRIWPIATEKQDRSWFDWGTMRTLFDEVRTELPDLSERQTILELQARYQRQFKRKAPGRTSLQTRMRKWRSMANSED